MLFDLYYKAAWFFGVVPRKMEINRIIGIRGIGRGRQSNV